MSISLLILHKCYAIMNLYVVNDRLTLNYIQFLGNESCKTPLSSSVSFVLFCEFPHRERLLKTRDNYITNFGAFRIQVDINREPNVTNTSLALFFSK